MRRVVVVILLMFSVNAWAQVIDTNQINTILHKGVSIKDSLPRKALEYFFNAESLAVLSKDPGILLKVYEQLRQTLLHTGDFTRALDYYEKSVETGRKVLDTPELLSLINNKGVLEYYTGNYPAALYDFLEVTRLAEKLNDTPAIITAYNNIGSIYRKINEPDSSLKFFEYSLDLAEKTGDDESVATALNNIGLIFMRRGEDSAAMEYFTKAAEYYRKVGDTEGLLTARINLGLAYANSGAPEQALAIYKSVEEDTNIEHYPRLKTELFTKLAINYWDLYKDYNLGKYLDSALYYSSKAYELARKQNLQDILVQNAKTLRDIYEAKGNYKQALYYSKVYSDLKDSLFSQEKLEQLLRLQYQLQLQQHKAHLAHQQFLLQQKNKEIISQRRKIAFLFAVSVIILLLLIATIILYVRNQREKTKIAQLEKKQEILINNIPGIVFLKDRDLRYTYVSEKFEQLTGVKPQDVIGKRDSDFSPKNTQCEEYERQVIATKQPVKDIEKQLDFFDRKIWLSITKIPIFDRNGEVSEILTFIQDVTEKKNTELKLKQLSIAVEQSGSIIVMTDINGTITYVNKKFTEVTGYSKEEAIGQNPRILNAGVRDKKFYKALWDTILSGKTWRGTFVNRKKNGEIFYEKAIITPIIMDGEIKGFIAIKEDITQERKNKMLLIEKTRQFENTINNMQDIYVRTDEKMRIIQASKSIARYLELESHRQVIGKPLFDVFRIENKQKVRFYLQELRRKKVLDVTFKYRTSTGKVRYAEGKIRLLENAKGLEGIVRDITKRVEWERELKRINQILSEKNKQIEEYSRNLTDNIRYAALIQRSLLPGIDEFKKFFSGAFVFYKPLRIVSGDFYYLKDLENHIVLALGDCTGHGVSAAFIGILAYSQLNDALINMKMLQPEQILERLRTQIKNVFKSGTVIRDGFDIALVVIDKHTLEAKFAGANQSIMVIKGGEATVLKGDLNPIGTYPKEVPFTCKKFTLSAGDLLYLYSDGFADQFGGPDGTKFYKRNFYRLLEEIKDLSMDEQKRILEETFEQWKGKYEQIDDVTVIGLKV